MFDPLEIKSHKGIYTVSFNDAFGSLYDTSAKGHHFIIDKNVAGLYRKPLASILDGDSVLLVDAEESNKSLEKFPGYVEYLVGKSIRRDHMLIAIGGGIIQDITCFLAATLLRGVPWCFYPTTLLAQADSCIGSKSSINSGGAKNILGTFLPPNHIQIDSVFLNTLPEHDLRSGIGEIIKVHIIDGPDSFDKIADDYDRLIDDKALLKRYIYRSLQIKKHYIEEDEFDRDIRNIFNYGHSFGHAIEAATNFSIPHGIAVTIGMDMANFVSANLGVGTEKNFDRMHPTLKKNYRGFEEYPIPMDSFIKAISKDKKNTGVAQVTLILPDSKASLTKDVYPNDDHFYDLCGQYLESVRRQ
ncbi:MAG: AroB-related putative sugar phosphate phospholyase (cyclizing) [Rhodospirillales bacterium]